jgi:hypothetical protein
MIRLLGPVAIPPSGIFSELSTPSTDRATRAISAWAHSPVPCFTIAVSS